MLKRPGFRPVFVALTWAALLLPLTILAAPTAEQHFEVLQIGTRSYTNVTVTSKTPTYIFLLHARGMENLRVKDLPRETLFELGYLSATNAAGDSNHAPTTWTKQTLAKIETPQVRHYEKVWQTWSKHTLAPLRSPDLKRSWLAQAVLGLGLICYVLFCHASKLLCRKAGLEAGPLVWVPVLQAIPLLRAAGMSGWWLLGAFIPLLNLIGYILWSVRIVKARGKGPLATLLLILPGTGILAFLYLAFSATKPPPAPAKTAPVKEETAFAIRA
jgi:hypothetical protein